MSTATNLRELTVNRVFDLTYQALKEQHGAEQVIFGDARQVLARKDERGGDQVSYLAYSECIIFQVRGQAWLIAVNNGSCMYDSKNLVGKDLIAVPIGITNLTEKELIEKARKTVESTFMHSHSVILAHVDGSIHYYDNNQFTPSTKAFLSRHDLKSYCIRPVPDESFPLTQKMRLAAIYRVEIVDCLVRLVENAIC